MKRKIIVLVICVLVASICFTACTTVAQPETSQEASTSAVTETTVASDEASDVAAPAKDMKFAVVLHALNSSFYTKIQEGAIQAGEDLGVQVDVMAPTAMNSLEEQVAMIESCIAAGYDGIATVVWDSEGFNDVIRKVKDAGITLIGINQDSPDSGREAFIGQDLEQSAYDLGVYFFDKVMGGEGTYIIASCAPTNTALIARQQGIERAAAEFPNIVEKQLIDIGTDLTAAVGVIENAYLANPDVTAFVGVDVYSEAIGTFIQAQNLNGKVLGAGFDLTEGTLNHIKNNAMQVTVGQNPFLQGYYPVVDMFLKTAYGYTPVDIATGAFFVTSENVADVEPE